MVSKLKTISTIIIIFFALASESAALEKSKFFPALLIISGVGLKFGSVYLEIQANEAYDNYLHTALQADMNKYTDEYEQKHTQSVIASRVAGGFWGLAIFTSIYQQFHSISVEKGSESTELGMRGSKESNYSLSDENYKLDLLSSPINMQTNASIRRFSDVLEVYGRNGDALFVINRRF